MSEASDVKELERSEAAALIAVDRTCTFGPSFFLGHLGRFVRDHCPDPKEHLPLVQIRLDNAMILDPCHIVGVSARWVVLAVHDTTSHPAGMVIEIVPFQHIQGVRIHTHRIEGPPVGFSQGHSPTIISAEALIQDALPHSTRAAG
jgi:hypothetical protein